MSGVRPATALARFGEDFAANNNSTIASSPARAASSSAVQPVSWRRASRYVAPPPPKRWLARARMQSAAASARQPRSAASAKSGAPSSSSKTASVKSSPKSANSDALRSASGEPRGCSRNHAISANAAARRCSAPAEGTSESVISGSRRHSEECSSQKCQRPAGILCGMTPWCPCGCSQYKTQKLQANCKSLAGDPPILHKPRVLE
mmetsp:Transcript_122228/g.390983  ORF Transcript_122228/g.390983 Transcript_122228/m.390983 type:complete len:206 (-) Transcript_122228:3037-3654(-)